MFKVNSLIGTFPFAPSEPCIYTSTINMIYFVTSESLRPLDPQVVLMEDESEIDRMSFLVELCTSSMFPTSPNDTS